MIHLLLTRVKAGQNCCSWATPSRGLPLTDACIASLFLPVPPSVQAHRSVLEQ